MSSLKRTVGHLLDPRSRLERLPRSASQGADGAGGGSTTWTRGRLRAGDVLLNLPLMIGTLIVLGLFLLALYGPLWAPKNPYIAGQHIVPHYDFERQEFIRPPLPPSVEFPLGTDRWGNDLLSLLMHGARNTLVACAFITMVRVILGLALGGIAGWNEGKLCDRVVMGSIGVLASVPMLLSSMILIYALDIRRGLPVFIAALSAVGWTEIAQYIRSEFLVLRKMPYIEGARAVGLNGLAMAVRHVLPNVLPQLLVISFLEMGAVMMLLGELGFVGVFIGGGSRIHVGDYLGGSEVFTLVEVPEWGAMLSEGFRWLRSKPFVVFPPAMAFFVSVLGFNALGEGLRRLVERNSLNTAFLLRKRMLLAIAGLVLATAFIMNNTGPAPWFSKVAGAFNGDLAYEHVKALAEMDGRGAGQAGGDEAAAYIARKFEAYGLEPGWKDGRFSYPLPAQLVRPRVQPYLALTDGDGNPVQTFKHQLDFGFVVEGHGGSGDVKAPLTWVGFEYEPGRYTWESFKGLDLRDRIVLLQQGNAPPDFATEALIRGARGVLWIAGHGRNDVRSQIQLAEPGQAYLRQPNIPIFRIRPTVAQALLQEDGYTLSDLLTPNAAAGPMPLEPVATLPPGQPRRGGAPYPPWATTEDRPDEDRLDDRTAAGSVTQSGPGWLARDLRATVHMALALSEPRPVEIPCVLGYKVGSDYDLAGELVVLFAHYDGLGMDPDGTVFPAANHNASGVGILLEMARLWQEQDLDARRSVLFVAWGGGQLDDSGARRFLAESRNYPRLSVRAMYGSFAPAMIFQLDDLGAGSDTLFVHPHSNTRLSALLKETAMEAGILAVSEQGGAGPYDDVIPAHRTRWIYLSWADAEVTPDQDRIGRIEPDKLQAVGKALALALTRVVRQSSY